MALKIRFRQQGSRNRQTFRLVVTDSRTRRDGKYCEELGFYNPALKNDNLKLNLERLNFWISKGAEISESAEFLIAKAAPEVIKGLKAKEQEKRVKQAAKRRQAKKKEAAPKKKEAKKAAPVKEAPAPEAEAPAKKAKAPAKKAKKKDE
jgi:small subunit ribosomal protein S16